MKTILLLVFGFLIAKSVCSQNDSSRSGLEDSKYAVTLMPALFPLGYAGLQPGFQFKIGNKLALLTEVGFVLLGDKKSQYDQTKFLKLASELKYYSSHAVPGRFYSLEVGFEKRNFADKDSGSYHNIEAVNRIGYSSLEIRSPLFFADIKWGREINEWRKVFVDVFFGLGVRIASTTYNTDGAYIIGPWDPPKDNFGWFIPASSWEYNKTIIRPHFAIGFRIGRNF